jgi:CopG family nickel-responsive transcriptional regulator
MENIERIGISLDKKLLADFDKLITKKGYENRSEAIRDLIREQLSSEALTNPKTHAVAVVVLVYDHHAAELMKKLTNLQHSHLFQTISSLHIHLDEHNCLEIITLKGHSGEINSTAENLISQRGVTLGKIHMVPSSIKHSHS